MPVKKFDQIQHYTSMLDIEFIEYGLFCGSDWNYTDLKAPYVRLYILLEGEAVVLLEREKIHLKQGHAYVLPSNMNFSCYTPNHMKKLYFHFSCKQWSHMNLLDQVENVLTRVIDIKRYDWMTPVLENNTITDYWTVKGSILELIYQFIGALSPEVFDAIQHQHSPEMLALFSRLRRGISAKTRTSDLADEMKMSPSMLSKSYKLATGMSLKHYLQQHLMEQAQMMLLSTNKSIKEIAMALAYEDPLYFSRAFHKWIGESPSRYRERNTLEKQ